jgi:hypothetical protein
MFAEIRSKPEAPEQEREPSNRDDEHDAPAAP